MKQLTKQSMKELIKYALEMPVGELQKYGTLFLSGPIPTSMTRGELIALQLLERASFGDLEAIKELRQWVVEDPKAQGAGGTTNYYQFLLQMASGEPLPINPETVKGLQEMASKIEKKVIELPASEILDDLT